MSAKSRRKGARHEREVAKEINKLLGTKAERGACNGKQGADDVVGLPGAHVECKRRKGIACLRWLEQSERDADQVIPIVVMREDRGDNVLMVKLSNLMRLAEMVAASTGRPVYPPALPTPGLPRPVKEGQA